MSNSKKLQINLGHSLSKRLYPISLGITLLISLCFPTTYYLLEYRAGVRSASHYAVKTADKFQEIIIAAPKLWKYQIYTFAEIKREITQGTNVVSIQLYDEKGLLIPDYGYRAQTDEAKSWWNKWAPKGHADIVFNNEKVGQVEISISQKGILFKTALLFAISSSVGLLLAFLSYKFPIRVVQQLEAELQEMFSSIQDAYKESDRLKHEAQQSEKRFRDLVDGLDAIVWEADAETRQFTFISQQVENLFHFSTNEWLAADDFFKDQIFPADREKVLDIMVVSCQAERKN